MTKQGAKRYTVADYYNEPMTIGGEETTRGKFIAEMRAAGFLQRAIDMYLLGHEQGQRARND